jgi:drug/metabolite transporter (DMT)-like permease
MGIGLGVLLLLVGLVLMLDVVDYDIPRVDDAQLGLLLIVIGALAIVLALVMNARSRRVEEHRYDHTT